MEGWIYPGFPTASFEEIERRFPGALDCIEWTLGMYYDALACGDARFVIVGLPSRKQPRLVLSTPLGKMRGATWWDEVARVWVVCSRSVSSRPRRPSPRLWPTKTEVPDLDKDEHARRPTYYVTRGRIYASVADPTLLVGERVVFTGAPYHAAHRAGDGQEAHGVLLGFIDAGPGGERELALVEITARTEVAAGSSFAGAVQVEYDEV